MIEAPARRQFRIRGAGWQLIQELENFEGEKRVVEYLLDGPRGTSKTVSVGWLFRRLAVKYPGIRMLFVRKTRRSITQSFCPDFERIVVKDDPYVLRGPSAAQRSEYTWANDSVLVLAGLDDPAKAYSTNYDVVVEEEGQQFTEDEHEQFRGVLRQWTPGMRFQLLLVLINPRHPSFWAMKRVKAGKMRRLRSYHQDNPKWHDGKDWTPEGRAYMDSLSSMTGVRRRRLYLGEWCSAEGAVWECWDEDRHVTSQAPDPKDARWYIAAMDWGFTDPCAFLVGAVNSKGEVTIVREIYRTKMGIEWWNEQVLAAYADYGFDVMVVDPSRPEVIDHFGKSIRVKNPKADPLCVRGAKNTRSTSPSGDLGGLDIVRTYMEQSKLRVWAGRMKHYPDEELVEMKAPLCLTDEIPEYTYWTPKGSEDARDATDKTDEKCADHGCDALRYLLTYTYGRDMSHPSKRKLPEGTPHFDAGDLDLLGR